MAATVTVLILSPFVLRRLARQAPRALVPLAVGGASLSIIAALLAAAALGDRVAGFFTFDPTVQARLNSLADLSRLASEHAVVGVGYNAFQFIVEPGGLLRDTSLHSRAGADNSFLTLLITTGIPGLLAFVLPWSVIATRSLHRWLAGGHVFSLVVVASISALTLHSQFVNSWLYGHLLIVIAVIVALGSKQPYGQVV